MFLIKLWKQKIYEIFQRFKEEFECALKEKTVECEKLTKQIEEKEKNISWFDFT